MAGVPGAWGYQHTHVIRGVAFGQTHTSCHPQLHHVQTRAGAAWRGIGWQSGVCDSDKCERPKRERLCIRRHTQCRGKKHACPPAHSQAHNTQQQSVTDTQPALSLTQSHALCIDNNCQGATIQHGGPRPRHCTLCDISGPNNNEHAAILKDMRRCQGGL